MNAEAKTLLKTLSQLVTQKLTMKPFTSFQRPFMLNYEGFIRPTFIEILPKIDLNGKARPFKPQQSANSTGVETTGGDISSRMVNEEESTVILKLSTFKRKKPKMRKDRARTIRRRLKRKSDKKKNKYNL